MIHLAIFLRHGQITIVPSELTQPLRLIWQNDRHSVVIEDRSTPRRRPWTCSPVVP